MSEPFVTNLRSRPTTIRMAPEGAETITIRVEMPDVWDVVAIAVEQQTPVVTVKVRALQALYPEAETHADFVTKLNGWEILNESESLADAGVLDGSILLVTFRRRRPVR